VAERAFIGLAAKKAIRSAEVFFLALGCLKLNGVLAKAHFKNVSTSPDMKLGFSVLLSQAAAQGSKASGGRKGSSKLRAGCRKNTEKSDSREISDGIAIFHAASRTEGSLPLQGSLCTAGRGVA
jgi:hypothetical protein